MGGENIKRTSKYIGTVINEIEIIGADYRFKREGEFVCKCLKCGAIFIKTINPIRKRTARCKCHNITKNHKRLHSIYRLMKHRCYCPKNHSYKNYGARGIKVCDKWLQNFNVFYEWAISNGYRDGLTIDRIDVNGNYEPSNCRWATAKEQANNKSNNHYVIYKNKKYTVSELATLNNIDRNVLNKRLRRGWDIEAAISKEVKK